MYGGEQKKLLKKLLRLEADAKNLSTANSRFDKSGKMRKKAAQNKKQYNKETLFPISFAIGYGSLLDPEGMERADKMMYENKKNMKAKMGTSIF